MRAPEFITFTGIDDFTDVAEMHALSRRYPIEWGILFSPKRQGVDPRYPGADAMSRFFWSNLRLSAHLCGDYARAIMGPGLGGEGFPADLFYVKRIQVNHAEPDPKKIVEFRNGWGRARGIAQTRGAEFPKDTSIDWLFDASGGRGIAPSTWPAYPGRMVGYAGGIGPENVSEVVSAINADGPYWIDMESGVRTHDRFDTGKCWQVCDAVFGSGHEQSTREEQ